MQAGRRQSFKMSIQVTTAPGALVALRLGVNNISILITLGGRVRNWWTAADGDKDFLSLLDEDASNILQPVTGLRQSLTRNRLSKGVVAEVSTLLQNSPVLQVNAGVPVLFQALDRPGLHYAATALYGTRAHVKVPTVDICMRLSIY